MAVLLVGIAVMGILMSAVMPVWRHDAQREKEEELIFRGEQYARAVGLFQRKFAGAFPPSVDLLVEQHFLRKKYKDPMTANGEFQILYQAMGTQRPGQVATPGTPEAGGVGAGVGVGKPNTVGPGTGAQGSQTPGTAAEPGTPGMQVAIATQTSALAGPRGGVVGVASKSTAKSIKLYRGRSRYNEWQFVYTAISSQAGAPTTSPRPGLPPGTAQPGGFPRPGMGTPQPVPGSGPSRPSGTPPRPLSPSPGSSRQ
jgi:type II secretory pathway pseudopilin PulG